MSGALVARPDTEQVDQIVKRLIEGEHERDIERGVSGEMPAAQRERLFAAVAERLRAAAKCDREVAVGFALEGLRSIYAKALAIADLAQARGALKDWITLALRHNVLDDGDLTLDEQAGEPDQPDHSEPPTERPDGKPSHQGRRTQAPRKPEASRRADPGLRRSRAKKTT